MHPYILGFPKFLFIAEYSLLFPIPTSYPNSMIIYLRQRKDIKKKPQKSLFYTNTNYINQHLRRKGQKSFH